MLRIKDVFDSTYPFYIFCRILGVINFKIVNFKGRKLLKITPLTMSRHILQFVALTSFLVNVYRKGIDQGRCSPKIFSSFLICCEDIATVILYVLGVIMSVIYSRKVVSIMNNINSIDVDLGELDVVANNWYIQFFCFCFQNYRSSFEKFFFYRF